VLAVILLRSALNAQPRSLSGGQFADCVQLLSYGASPFQLGA
jgi:hypothetical protein